jgi:hypothetical protein
MSRSRSQPDLVSLSIALCKSRIELFDSANHLCNISLIDRILGPHLLSYPRILRLQSSDLLHELSKLGICFGSQISVLLVQIGDSCGSFSKQVGVSLVEFGNSCCAFSDHIGVLLSSDFEHLSVYVLEFLVFALELFALAAFSL